MLDPLRTINHRLRGRNLLTALDLVAQRLLMPYPPAVIGASSQGRRRPNSARGLRSGIVLVTAHPGLDYAALAQRSSLFIDLRGVTRGVRLDNLVRL